MILCALSCAASCRRDSHDKPPAPALSEADERARDRALTMERQGAACDAGDGAARDLAACREACALGHSNSCGWLGDAHAFGLGVERDDARALERYREACRGGSGLGCEGLARSYRLAGDAANSDRHYREARMVYRVHCEQRHAVSCSRLAGLYRAGLGGPVAEDVARTYQMRACALGKRDDC